MRQLLTVFEHDVVRFDKGAGQINENQIIELQKYHTVTNTPFYKPVYNGVQFNEYVGVIRVGQLTIEVLPKIDRNGAAGDWKRILINMLRTVGVFEVAASSEALLNIKSNSILDIYISLFLTELQSIFHKGLIKRYRKMEENLPALKGSLVFSKHVTRNIVHQERFFVKHSVYDVMHPLNRVFFKCLKLVRKINTSADLQSRVSSLLISFPEMEDIYVDDSWFSNFKFTRKTEPCRRALNIARMLLMNYHPDINQGGNHVLALMFDMNLLWETFVLASLKKNKLGYSISGQQFKPYWHLVGRRPVNLKPDILLSDGKVNYVVDTKWKILKKGKPDFDDLQQMYAYTKYFNSTHTLLCYPGDFDHQIEGNFYHESSKTDAYPCSTIMIGLDPKVNITEWQNKICTNITDYLKTKAPARKVLPG